MAKTKYKIVNDFQVRSLRVLVLDSDYECFSPGKKKAYIDSVEYDYTLNSVNNWVVIKSRETFKGKTVEFKRVED